MQALAFTQADIRRAFDAGTLSRGKRYAETGHVWELELLGDAIAGAVSGSDDSVYEQDVRWKKDGGRIRFEGNCSCPVGYNCKHVVALLFDYLDTPPEQAAQVLQPLTSLWLR